MMTTAAVKLWGTPVGVFHLNENKGCVSFEYEKDFLSNGINVAPIMMPLLISGLLRRVDHLALLMW